VESFFQIVGQYCDAILATFSGVNSNCPAAEIKITHSESQTFQHAKPGAIHQTSGQSHVGSHLYQQRRNLRAAEHHRQAAFRFGSHHIFQPRQFNFEYLPVQEQ